MTLQHVVYRDRHMVEFTVADESIPFTATAAPIITASSWGITVGLFHHTQSTFAYWQSSQTCDVVTAWRVAHILRRLVQLRNQRYGYDSTIGGLVIAMNGDRHEDRMRERAKDLGMTVDEFTTELDRLSELWPSAPEVTYFWDQLPVSEQDKLPGLLREAIAAGHIEAIPLLVEQIETAERRLSTIANQRAHEDELIAAGLDPATSLRQFLLDIGVTNLVYTIGYGDIGEPTHFGSTTLDREIMGELIGSHGYCSRVVLATTAKEPDDPSAHLMQHGPGMALYWSDFGKHGHPRVMLEGEPVELVYVQWSRDAGCFTLAVRPQGLSDRDDSQDILLSIADLRARIGTETGLSGPLPPGATPEWLKKPSARHALLRLLGPDRRRH